MARRNALHTIYHAMDAAGYFDSNPANVQSRDADNQPLYVGPVEFPKMLYHPDGESEITNPGEVIVTPFGPKIVGEQKQMIYRIVKDAKEEAKLRAEGWHLSAQVALGRSGAEPGGISIAAQLERLQKMQAEMAAEMQRLMAEQLADSEANRTANKTAQASPGAKRAMGLPTREVAPLPTAALGVDLTQES